jgi:hypothetical protein
LNGKGGARLGEQIGFHFSRMTDLARASSSANPCC